MTHFLFGDVEIRPDLNLIFQQGEEKTVTPRVMDILVYLVVNRERVVSSDELLAQFWPGRVVEESTIHRHISQIRSLLGDSAREPQYIKTVNKRGYQAIASTGCADPENATIDSTAALVESSDQKASNQLSLLVPLALALVFLVSAALLSVFIPKDENNIDSAAPYFSVAVFPFKNMSQVSNLDLYSEGLGDSILNDLAAVDGLQVPSRTETFRLWKEERNVDTIAHDLGVAYFLEGSVQKDNHLVRITAQLIRAIDGYHVWSKQYDISSDLSLGDQATLAANISHNLRTMLNLDVRRSHPEEFEEFKGVEPEALRFYFDAQQEYARHVAGDIADPIHSLDLMRKAAELDPNFRAAQLELAWYYTHRVDPSVPPLRAAELAHEILDNDRARHGETIDEIFYRAQVHLFLQLDYVSAERLIKHGLELQPEGRWWNHLLWEIANREGRSDDAFRLIERARRHDYLEESPISLACYTLALFDRKQFEQVIEVTEQIADIVAGGEPMANALRMQALAYLELGSTEASLPLIERAWAESGHLFPAAYAVLFARTGQYERARSVLDSPVVSGRRADHIFGLMETGDGEQAIALLTEAIADRDKSVLMLIRTSRLFESVRSRVGFDGILSQLSLLETRTDAGLEG